MMNDLVKVAIITAIPPLISSFIWGWVNHTKIRKVEVIATQAEKNGNDLLNKITEQRNLATSRADFAEGRQEGAASERDKSP